MEDKELQELEEFTLEDIIREFSDHPIPEQEEAAEDKAAEEVAVEEAAEETAVEEVAVEQTAAEEEITEVAVEEATIEEVTEETPAEEVTAEEAPAEEAPDAEALLSGDTIRLESAELLKGVVHDAQHITDEEEEVPAPSQEEEKPAFTEEWEPEYGSSAMMSLAPCRASSTVSTPFSGFT